MANDADQNGTVRYVGLLFAIVASMYGSTQWVGRDVDVLRNNHNNDILAIRNTLKDKLTATREIIDAERKVIDAENSRVNSDIRAMEEWRTWWYQTRLPIDIEQDRRLMMLERQVYKQQNISGRD